MEAAAVKTLQACMEQYNAAMRKVVDRLKPGDGLLGFGRDPKRDPCHMEFYEAVGEAVGRMVQGGLAQEDRYITLTQPMREAVQGHVRLLVPFLEPEAAREMSVWYGKAYPRRRRLPVQSQLFQELERRARRR